MENVLRWISSISVLVLIWALIRGESVAWARYNQLMKVMGGLKFRLFDLEARVLGSDGVYIPEDMAERYARFVESQLTLEELEGIKKRYKDEAPENIPFWKYLVSNFRLKVSIQKYGLIAAVDPEIDQVREIAIKQMRDLTRLFEQQKLSAKALTEMSATVDGLKGTLTNLQVGLTDLHAQTQSAEPVRDDQIEDDDQDEPRKKDGPVDGSSGTTL